MWKQIILSVLILPAFLIGCTSTPKEVSSPFIQVKNGQFIRNGQPYYYIGANFWYGAILASEGTGGNRERLHRELDFLKAIGVDNLRILVGSDGKRGVPTKVEPTLQEAPGIYNDTILAGLDYLLAEMEKRDMLAVLYLNNSWEWSGGYSQYLAWARGDKAPVPAVDGWPAFMNYVKEFVVSDSAQALFANHVKYILTRTNRYTHRKYTDDPTIMSWQIGNEPRAFASDSIHKAAFAEWMSKTSSLIRSLDPNHLISTGSEGKHGCEEDIALFEKVHADTNIDYMNIHIWPYNWGWAPKDSLQENLEKACTNTQAYINEHLNIAKKYQKPLVLEEFGYPRDSFQFGKNISTHARDGYYKCIFDLIVKHATHQSLLAGCNFWGWGGLAVPSSEHVFWQTGDDYTGDPAQEEQGLNSVFASDSSTISLIHTANKALLHKSETSSK